MFKGFMIRIHLGTFLKSHPLVITSNNCSLIVNIANTIASNKHIQPKLSVYQGLRLANFGLRADGGSLFRIINKSYAQSFLLLHVRNKQQFSIEREKKMTRILVLKPVTAS